MSIEVWLIWTFMFPIYILILAILAKLKPSWFNFYENDSDREDSDRED